MDKIDTLRYGRTNTRQKAASHFKQYIHITHMKILSLKYFAITIFVLAFIQAITNSASAQQQEKLDRGLVAMKTTSGVFVSWRVFASDADSLKYNLYRDGRKLNSTPLYTSNFSDAAGTVTSQYQVRMVLGGTETGDTSKTVTPWTDFFKKIQLQRPTGGVTPQDEVYSYTPSDCSAGDLDGDGEYELVVKWDPTNSRDNSQSGYTGNVYLDGYKLDGTFLWRIDLGCNIRAGAHYTQFMVYDLDGDGRAEVACKTAPGTIDGKGRYVLMGSDLATADYRNTNGIIITGPEYLTIFDGITGAERTTVPYYPPRNIHAETKAEWGDDYGNRSERYLACIAYLDGKKPSLVMCRGYYTYAYLTAYDYDGTSLKQHWVYVSPKAATNSAYGQGAHNLSVADVDGDGCDEIIYGAATIDHDGTLLYSTNLKHGDALHVSDLDPDRDGLEVFMPHEEITCAEIHDARTGEILCRENGAQDVGRGLAADIDPNYRGFEWWSSATKIVHNCKGDSISNSRPSINFRIYWDGDLCDELLDGTVIDKWNATAKKTDRLVSLYNYGNSSSCNGTKSTPNLQADLLGDWREEVVLWSKTDSASLYIFSTNITSKFRVPTLMHDHVYRMGVAWQNVAYNQPPHLGYYLPDAVDQGATLTKVGAGNLIQTISLGDPIETIVYKYQHCTGVAVGNLPEGLTYTVDETAHTITISGIPTTAGNHLYSLATVGGAVNNTKLTAILRVLANTISDIASYHFDGNLTNSVTTTDATATHFIANYGADGIQNECLHLSGTPADGRISQSHYDALAIGSQSFSVALWFRSTDQTDASKYLLHKGSFTADTATGATGKWFGVECKNGNLSFAIDDNAAKSSVSVPATVFLDGRWNYVVGVRDANAKKLKLYVNGQLVSETDDGTGDISQTEDLVIGNCNVNFDAPFTGDLDEVSIISGSLTASEVLARYSAATSLQTTVADRFVTIESPFFNRYIQMHFNATKATTAHVRLVSENSGMVIADEIFRPDGNMSVTIGGLQTLAKGTYTLHITSPLGNFTKRLVKVAR
jgi:hypothetical protein